MNFTDNTHNSYYILTGPLYVTDANVTLNYCNFESNGASTDLGRTDFKGGAFYCENQM